MGWTSGFHAIDDLPRAQSLGPKTGTLGTCGLNEPIHEKRLFEPRRVKTNKMSVRLAKIQISPVWSESSLSAWRNLGSLATHWAHIPRLIWVFAGRTLILVCFVLSWLICHMCHKGRTTKAQTSLRMRAVSPELSLFEHTKMELISVSRAHVLNRLLRENRKSIPKMFNGKNLFKNVTFQVFFFPYNLLEMLWQRIYIYHMTSPLFSG